MREKYIEELLKLNRLHSIRDSSAVIFSPVSCVAITHGQHVEQDEMCAKQLREVFIFHVIFSSFSVSVLTFESHYLAFT